ncbi:MAG: carboxylating nicotinate-nucleotide diphosphorylase [Flavobacteriales bacterium]|nr:carboxylating nicotinate-nucleotide diphosphorylase [Flavobacteriales bacterium]
MQDEINHFLQRVFDEDIKDGDHSSLACIPHDAKSSAKLLVKEDGLLAGVELAQLIFHFIDPELIVDVFVEDGKKVNIGDVAFHVHGSSQNILKAERTVLNCMQRMSAIATKTNAMVKLLDGLSTKVLDTRKTTPGVRFIEKWAVRIGGGTNHRFGLYDMIMLKDNHIDYAGGIEMAIEKTNRYLKENGKNLKIEIETRNLEEVKEVLRLGKIDRIMLDNFSYEDIRTAVVLIDGKYETEASGGITMTTAREYAECGVDFISVGALTHSVHNMDLSLKAFTPTSVIN